MYEITEHSYKKAHQLGLEIFSSENPKKKIDVYKDGIFLESIGDPKYSDYCTYLAQRCKVFADNRRRLYKIRHPNENLKGLLASAILW